MFKRISDRDGVQARAATFAAEDELSDAEIAQRCGITRRTLMRWKKQPAFGRKLEDQLRVRTQESQAQVLVERQNRIADLDCCWQKLQDIVRERANSPEMESVPGGVTGLLRRRKVFFSQGHGKLVADYQVDTALLRAMRGLEVQASKALGQWQQPLEQPTAPPSGIPLPTAKQERAALLLADGKRSDFYISVACGVTRRTLARWKKQSRFYERVAELRTAWAQCQVPNISSKSERLRKLDWRLRKLNQIVQERAKSPEMQSVPGGRTGLLFRQRSLFGRGVQAIFLENFLVDNALTREELLHLKQAAKELGQWPRKWAKRRRK